MLRNEPGIYFEDLYPLVASLPRYAYASDGTDANDLLPLWQASHDKNVAPLKRVETHTTSRTTTLDDVDKRTWSTSYRPRSYYEFDPEKVLPVVYTDHPLRPSRLPPQMGFFDYFPILRPIKRIPKMFKPKQVEVHDDERFIGSPISEGRPYIDRQETEPIVSNVPLQIILHLSSYNAFLLKNNLVSPPVGSALTSSVAALHDAISGLDRIKATPLPFAYQAHLRMTLWCENLVSFVSLRVCSDVTSATGSTFFSFLYVSHRQAISVAFSSP